MKSKLKYFFIPEENYVICSHTIKGIENTINSWFDHEVNLIEVNYDFLLKGEHEPRILFDYNAYFSFPMRKYNAHWKKIKEKLKSA